MKKLSTEQLQAAAETLRRVQAKLARSGNLPLEPTIYASAKGFRRNVPEYVWSVSYTHLTLPTIYSV